MIDQIGPMKPLLVAVAICLVIGVYRLIGSWWGRRNPRITLGIFMRGAVYIFLDHSLPGFVIKIGRTGRKDVEVRMAEVMRDMGGDLTVVYKLLHVPFPIAVEFAAHQLMAGKRIYWGRGSRRGREWFRVGDEKGLMAAMAKVERAARLVRRKAKQNRRWPAKADRTVWVWRLAKGRMLNYLLFR